MKSNKELKVLQIIPSLGKGGAERLVIDLVRELSVRSNIRINLIVFRNEISYKTDNISNLIHSISSKIAISIWRKNTFNTQALQEFINDFKPDIIHSHLFEAEIVSRSCSYPKAKWYSHFHDNMKGFKRISLPKNKAEVIAAFEKKFLFDRYRANGGNNFIAISESTFKFAKEVTSGLGSVTKLPNAIDYKRFYSERDISLDDKIRLINVGSFQKIKNQAFLLDVLAKVREMNLEAELTFLGDGEERVEVEQKANRMNLDKFVTFEGNVENVENYLKKSTIYVHASVSEAFGLTLVEAMAAGLPVITLNGGGNKDLVLQSKNGYIFDQQDAELFANTISDLWKDKKRLKTMSDFAKKYAENYDISKYTDHLINLYNN